MRILQPWHCLYQKAALCQQPSGTRHSKAACRKKLLDIFKVLVCFVQYSQSCYLGFEERTVVASNTAHTSGPFMLPACLSVQLFAMSEDTLDNLVIQVPLDSQSLSCQRSPQEGLSNSLDLHHHNRVHVTRQREIDRQVTLDLRDRLGQ